METKRLENADKEATRKKDQKPRKAALAQASALPRPEAEKSIERRIKDIVEPLRAEISSIKERLQESRSAPNVAGAGGAAAKSAQSSRSADVHRKAVDGDKTLHPNLKRKRKLRRRSNGSGFGQRPSSSTSGRCSAAKRRPGKKARTQSKG